MLARWFSARSLGLHLVWALIVAGCAIAGFWQLGRATGGNTLSWAYTFEWPAFAIVATIGWWQMIHDDPADRAARRRQHIEARAAHPETVIARRVEDESDELRAYNDYLASLAATGAHKTWRNPRGVG